MKPISISVGSTAAQLLLVAATLTVPVAAYAVKGLRATGHDSRIDLEWKQVPGQTFDVYRCDTAAGTFKRINMSPVRYSIYSDFLGANQLKRYYQVRPAGSETATSPVSATTRAMTEAKLLTSVQEAVFRYFWHGAHPESGVTREGIDSGHPGNTGALGGTGMGLMALVVGAERDFVTRTQAAERVLQILRFFDEKVERYRGAWPHWFDAGTGKTIPFSKYDDGGDLVETAVFIQGVLTARQYFDGADATEREIREKAVSLWCGVEWDKYQRGDALLWHWSPNHEFKLNMELRGFYEAQITYLLAVASPENAIAPSSYSAWTSPAWYRNGRSFYGIKLDVGPDWGGPLFWVHYSYLGFDPRNWHDGITNYFDHGRNVALIHNAHGAANPFNHKGYSARCWGMAASFNPFGYAAHNPAPGVDNGTINPTGALGSMPYTPAESLAALRHFYYDHGAELWGQFGFKDGFNMNEDWVFPGYLAINHAPILIMIENYRSGLCWRMFMKNPEIRPALKAMGWTQRRAKSLDRDGEIRR